MNRTQFFSRFYYILFSIAVLSIPFTSFFYFFLTPLLLVFWIIEGDWKNKWNRLKESRTLIITCCLALFWFINIIGLFYSNDLIKGITRTYDKLPFLVYPLVFFTLDKTFFTEKRVYTLFKGFLCATAAMLMLNWGNAWIQYFTTSKAHHFYYIYLSNFSGHPSYCTLIVCIAFTIAFYFFNNPTKSQAAYRMPHTIHQCLWIILLLFFAISIYFFQSRSGILAFVFVLIFSFFHYLRTRKTYWYAIGGILAILLLAVITIKLFPSRVGYYMKNMNTEQLQAKDMLGLRSKIWNISYQLAMEHKMWGIGTGYDAEGYLTDDELVVFGKPSFINTHNQFLQTLLEHGILGLFLLVFLIMYSFYFAIKTKNYLLLMLVISISINIFFESMFERSRGIFTFSLFYCLFIVKNNIFASSEKINKIYE
ncbi:MAG: O-antigen ligase family protein [Lentimicrobiaceae bacterium]|nr:O-antigen ligase family protein [Lentimicrobiaceae bacterium]